MRLSSLSSPAGRFRYLEHAANLLFILVLVEARIKVLPPLEQHGLADQLEPGRELQARILEERLQLPGRHILCRLDLVLVDVEINVGLDEEDIVDYKLACQFLVVMSPARRKIRRYSLSCSPHLPSLGAL
jgi:hypothetical protein